MDTGPTGSNELSVADLYAEYGDPLERYALRLTRDAHQADDLVQETMMRAMIHLPLLGRLNPYQRKAWLYRVLRNRFLDEKRTEKRAQTMLQQVAKQAACADARALPADIEQLLERVPSRYRDVLEKRYALGMTSIEIGNALGVPAATARSRLHAAIKWLRANQHVLI
jgi:RNA polymerase sigma-70 factor (ECF subfamily)